MMKQMNNISLATFNSPTMQNSSNNTGQTGITKSALVEGAIKSPSTPKKQVVVQEKTTVSHFEHGFQFNVLGIMNTPKEQSIYTVTAEVFDHSFEIRAVNWDATTKRNFIFVSPEQTVEFKRTFDIRHNTCIVYKVSRYCLDTLKTEHDYAFAI